MDRNSLEGSEQGVTTSEKMTLHDNVHRGKSRQDQLGSLCSSPDERWWFGTRVVRHGQILDILKVEVT